MHILFHTPGGTGAVEPPHHQTESHLPDRRPSEARGFGSNCLHVFDLIFAESAAALMPPTPAKLAGTLRSESTPRKAACWLTRLAFSTVVANQRPRFLA